MEIQENEGRSRKRGWKLAKLQENEWKKRKEGVRFPILSLWTDRTENYVLILTALTTSSKTTLLSQSVLFWWISALIQFRHAPICETTRYLTSRSYTTWHWIPFSSVSGFNLHWWYPSQVIAQYVIITMSKVAEFLGVSEIKKVIKIRLVGNLTFIALIDAN